MADGALAVSATSRLGLAFRSASGMTILALDTLAKGPIAEDKETCLMSESLSSDQMLLFSSLSPQGSHAGDCRLLRERDTRGSFLMWQSFHLLHAPVVCLGKLPRFSTVGKEEMCSLLLSPVWSLHFFPPRSQLAVWCCAESFAL